MWKKIKNWTGLTRRSEYIIKYFHDSNVRASVYMSLIVIALELWMIESLTEYVLTTEKVLTTMWLIDHYGWYVGLLICAVILLIYALAYLKKKTRNRLLGKGIIWMFVLMALAFGFKHGYNSYVQGEQILAFLTMAIFVLCLLTWKPVVSFVLSVAAFGGFYLLIDKAQPATQATQVNLFTMWISCFVVAVSLYHQRLSEAHKTESVEKMNEHLRKISTQDELTKIHNMRYFRKHAKRRMAHAFEEEKTCTFLYLDMENFKYYNDRYGFHEGDVLLQQFAQRLEEIFQGDLVARFSDDHFVVLTTDEKYTDKIEQARIMLKDMEGEVKLELKTGIYRPKKADQDVDHACDRARIAANSIKKKYDCLEKDYDENLNSEVKWKQYVINNLDEALEKNYIKVFYQPIINCISGNLVGLEALARWQDPEEGLLAPGRFISILEEYRLIHKLDQRIIEIVCRDLHIKKGTPLENIPVSINFSQLDFDLYDVPAVLMDTAAQYEVPFNLLDVEITESALNGNAEKLKGTMEYLRENKFSQWLDDFGSGYSSLNVLNEFHFDVLKIDMMFLRGFDKYPNSKLTIRTIVDLAKKLGMVSLTEGVETKEQFQFLKEIGCDKAQGYYFSKPVPHEDLVQAVKEGRLQI